MHLSEGPYFVFTPLLLFVTITLMFSRIDFSTFFPWYSIFFSLALPLKSVTGVLRERLLSGQSFKGCCQSFDLLDLSLKILHSLRGESKLTRVSVKGHRESIPRGFPVSPCLPLWIWSTTGPIQHSVSLLHYTYLVNWNKLTASTVSYSWPAEEER